MNNNKKLKANTNNEGRSNTVHEFLDIFDNSNMKEIKEITEIEETLAKCHSNFQAYEYVKRKSKSEVEQTIKRIEEESDDYAENGLESIRAQNLVSFLYCLIGDEKKALDLNTKVQNEDPTNIVAICNKAWILYHRKQYSECKMVIKTLAQHNEDRLLRLTSKAEVAYSYSRLGMHAYEEAIKLFDEVNRVCKECGKTDERHYEFDSDQQSATNAEALYAIPKDNVCVWTYGMALTMRRKLHLHCHDEESKIDISKQQYARVLRLLYEVASMQEKTSLINKYRGRAYVEIGHVIYGIEQITPKVFPYGVKSIVPELLQLHNTSEYFYDLGRQICHHDPFVLQKCGVYYRYIKRVEESIRFLDMALHMKESSYTYHHLGLSLQRKIILEQSKSRSLNQRNRTTNMHYQPRFNKRMEKNVVTQYGDQLGQLSTSLSKLSLKENRVAGNNCTTTKCHTRFPARQVPNASSENQATIHTPITNLMKSPRYVKFIKEAKCRETVKRIFVYFDKAIELSENNNVAIYDKGLLHRHLKQNKEAIDVFRGLINNIEEKHNSRVLLANAYEQAAFCCLDMIATGDVEWALKENARIYLKIAIEIACDLVDKIPFLENCWKGLDTFSSIVKGEAKSKQTLEDQHFLYYKLRNFVDDIDILNELKAIAEDDKEKMQISLKIVNDYIMLKNYDESVFTLEIMKCYGYSLEDAKYRSLYLTAHIEGGIEAYKRKEKGLASLRFRKALNFKRTCENEELNINEDTDGSECNEQYDIYIVCSVEAEETGRKFAALLENIGLRVTINDDNVLPGSWIAERISNIIEASTHFIVLVDSNMNSLHENMDENVKTIAKVIEDRDYGNVLVVKAESNINVPTVLSKTYPVVEFFEIAMGTTCDHINDFTLQKLKDIFLQIA